MSYHHSKQLHHGSRALHTSCSVTSGKERGSDVIDDDFYIAGGSSGGSAVAVATGSCFG